MSAQCQGLRMVLLLALTSPSRGGAGSTAAVETSASWTAAWRGSETLGPVQRSGHRCEDEHAPYHLVRQLSFLSHECLNLRSRVWRAAMRAAMKDGARVLTKSEWARVAAGGK